MDFKYIWDFFLQFANTLYDVWIWLITDLNVPLLGAAKPIELILGSLIITGIIRAIVGVLG